MIVVSDTSPITALLTVGELDLIFKLFGDVIIPVSVYTELLQTHSQLPPSLRIQAVSDLTSAAEFRKLVDPGEAEAIQLAKELHADRLLIDDAKGRKLAAREGLAIIGLLGIVLAKSRRLVPSARVLLTRLRDKADVYLSEELVEAALKSVQE
jgi:uncharacterized protein